MPDITLCSGSGCDVAHRCRRYTMLPSSHQSYFAEPPGHDETCDYFWEGGEVTVAALFVQRGGCYWGLDGVDPWDEARDARKYAGPHPVVAHPPCARWSVLASLVESLGGKKRGDDDGCFESALASVQTYGGVLEHPAASAAWTAHGLGKPDRRGGWQRTVDGGWSCYVEQGRYGHVARKGTWLYVSGIEDPPALRWGYGLKTGVTVTTSRGKSPGPEMLKSQRHVTPIAFRDLLLSLARSASGVSNA